MKKVTIGLDRDRELVFNINAVAELEDRYDVPLKDMFSEEQFERLNMDLLQKSLGLDESVRDYYNQEQVQLRGEVQQGLVQTRAGVQTQEEAQKQFMVQQETEAGLTVLEGLRGTMPDEELDRKIAEFLVRQQTSSSVSFGISRSGNAIRRHRYSPNSSALISR